MGDVKFLEPRVSIHGESYVYLCSIIAHATLYAVKCHMYPYGFNKENGRLSMSEPFEEYLKEIYSGKSGYVYEIEEVKSISPLKSIPNAYVTRECVEVASVEFIEDVYERLIVYERKGMMEIRPYNCMTDKSLNFYHRSITKIILENKFLDRTDDYPMFLKEKFPKAWLEACNTRKGETSST